MKKYCFYRNKELSYRNYQILLKYQLLFSYKITNENIEIKEYQDIKCIREFSKHVIISKNRKTWYPTFYYGPLAFYALDSIIFHKASEYEYAYEFEAENDEDAINQIKLLIEIGEIK